MKLFAFKIESKKTIKLNYDTAYLDALHHYLIFKWRDCTTNSTVIDQHSLKAVQREIDLVNKLPIVKEYGNFRYIEDTPDFISDNWHIIFDSNKIKTVNNASL